MSVLCIEMKKWYVVYEGRVPRVYDEWEDCLKQVNNFKGNNYKGYKSKEEAEARYLNHLLAEERKKPDEDQLHRDPRLAHRDCGSPIFHCSLGD